MNLWHPDVGFGLDLHLVLGFDLEVYALVLLAFVAGAEFVTAAAVVEHLFDWLLHWWTMVFLAA